MEGWLAAMEVAVGQSLLFEWLLLYLGASYVIENKPCPCISRYCDCGTSFAIYRQSRVVRVAAY